MKEELETKKEDQEKRGILDAKDREEKEFAFIEELKQNKDEMKIEDEKYLLNNKKKISKISSIKRNAASFVPFLGSALDIKDAVKGKESYTKKDLSKNERIVKAVFGVGGAALDVATLGADRLLVGAGETALKIGTRNVASAEVRNIAIKNLEKKKLANKAIEAKNAKKFVSNFNIKNFNIKNWLEKRKKLNIQREHFKNLFPIDETPDNKS